MGFLAVMEGFAINVNLATEENHSSTLLEDEVVASSPRRRRVSSPPLPSPLPTRDIQVESLDPSRPLDASLSQGNDGIKLMQNDGTTLVREGDSSTTSGQRFLTAIT